MKSLCREWAKKGKKPPARKTPQWHALVKKLEGLHGRGICAAYLRTTGWPCEWPQRPNGRCYRHGGASLPPGPTHPTYQTGRYSKALNGRPIQELYERARSDPHLLALTEDIALLVGKQQETLASLGTGEGEQGWRVALTQTRALRDSIARGADGEAATALDVLENVLESGIRTGEAWGEYTARAEQIRKLVDTERKYQEGLRLYLPLDRANAIMGVWMDVIRRVVPQQYIAMIHEEFRSLRQAGSMAGSMPTIGAGRDVTTLARKKRGS